MPLKVTEVSCNEVGSDTPCADDSAAASSNPKMETIEPGAVLPLAAAAGLKLAPFTTLPEVKVGAWPLVVPKALNVAGLPASEPELAVTVFTPGCAPSLRTVEAFPAESVVACVTLNDPPPAVTAKVTAAPGIGMLSAPTTFTTNGCAS